MFISLLQTFAVVALLISSAFAADPALGKYNIGDDITVSGLSSGGFMAVQLHVAYSGTFKGAAVYAGGPYWCAEGDINTAQYVCMAQLMGKPDVNKYISYTDKAAAANSIDPTSNLADDQVYLFSGNQDSTVNPLVMKDLSTYYQHYLNSSSTIISQFDLAAEHCIPTLNYGEPCDVHASPYIGKCAYDGAGTALNWLYGKNLIDGMAVASHLTAFDQTPFLPQTAISVGNTGYIYVPAACADGKTQCKLHVALHGCKQDLASIGNKYADHTGFNGWAEANNIIVLYPYAISSSKPSNPNACWDWWGYTGSDYVYKSGKQMKFIKDLVDHLVTKTPATPTTAPVPSPAPVTVPTQPPQPTFLPTIKPTSGFVCQEWSACVWDHYTAGRAVFSQNYAHYACKGSLQDLGLTGYCGGAVGVNTPVTVKTTATDYYELGSC